MDKEKDLGLLCAWKKYPRHQLSLATPASVGPKQGSGHMVICLEAARLFRLTYMIVNLAKCFSFPKMLWFLSHNVK